MKRRFCAPISRVAFAVVFAGSCLFAISSSLCAATTEADYLFSDGYEQPPDCSLALSCSAPPVGKSCIAGRVTAAGSGTQLRAPYKPQLACAAGAGGGPCDLSIAVHDAVQWASNPTTSAPLASADTIIDGCGRFRFSGITPPSSGYAAVVIDDAPSSGDDLYVPSASFHGLAANATVPGLTTIATLHDTVDGWTLSAGVPFGGSTFADVGVILFSFTVAGSPRSGVVVTKGGSVSAGDDYYYSDTQPSERYIIDSSLAQTGVNGSALFVNGALTTYSGTGGEPMGCTWPSVSATTVSGAVVFVEIGC